MVLPVFLIFKLESMIGTENNIFNFIKKFKIVVYGFLIKNNIKIIANLLIKLQCAIKQ